MCVCIIQIHGWLYTTIYPPWSHNFNFALSLGFKDLAILLPMSQQNLLWTPTRPFVSIRIRLLTSVCEADCPLLSGRVWMNDFGIIKKKKEKKTKKKKREEKKEKVNLSFNSCHPTCNKPVKGTYIVRKVKNLYLRENFNWIFNFMSHVLYNLYFCIKWIIECKNRKVQI